ncbi:MAG: effector-associated domain EAD1-containing protein [Caldilinea sp.]|uniref:effector-associated domain EAD1-containing protein n=1 Tax=Caldilinea sp. TaxID=2293560 RepID=UPI002C4425AC|nr:effector-associated domain EAD1-containing protein [Caldilinea sp.]HRA65936.1 effector-associated domain EAD1-containing protein [Caldilinea sp.]
MLSDAQHKQLLEALLSALPSKDKLRMMVKLELDANLDEVAGGETLSVVAFKLVTWAESSGRIQALVDGAVSQQPGNPEVKKLVAAARTWGAVARPFSGCQQNRCRGAHVGRGTLTTVDSP